MSWIKKTFFLSLLAFSVSLLFWGVYNLSFKKATPIAQEAPKTTTKAETPVTPKKVDTESIAAISDEAVISPIFTNTGNAIKYYSKSTGKVYQIDPEGNGKKILQDKELIGLNDVIWSPDKVKVITKFVTPNQKNNFFYYNSDIDKATQLKSNLDEVAWQSSSNKIFYKYFDPQTKKRTLNVSDPDGTNWNKLADLDFKDLAIAQIPQSGLVSFWNKGDAFAPTTFKTLPLIGGEEKVLLKDLFGADYLWDTKGNQVLLSYVDSKGGHKTQLALVNSNGGEFNNLNIPTLVSKCVWSKNSTVLYYALPGGIPDSAIMPNDYFSGKFNTTDTFWKIDLSTGEKTRLIDLEKINGKFDAQDLFLNSDESILFFVNRIDGKLYRITL